VLQVEGSLDRVTSPGCLRWAEGPCAEKAVVINLDVEESSVIVTLLPARPYPGGLHFQQPELLPLVRHWLAARST